MESLYVDLKSSTELWGSPNIGRRRPRILSANTVSADQGRIPEVRGAASILAGERRQGSDQPYDPLSLHPTNASAIAEVPLLV